jgi:hypothetical protein
MTKLDVARCEGAPARLNPALTSRRIASACDGAELLIPDASRPPFRDDAAALRHAGR